MVQEPRTCVYMSRCREFFAKIYQFFYHDNKGRQKIERH